MQNSQAYLSHLTDGEWVLVKKLVPQFQGFGRPPIHSRRAILDGIFYLVRAGCAWRMLPHDLPPWQTLYGYFRQWQKRGVWQAIHDALRTPVRVHAGKQPAPTAAILDSQTVKIADQAGERGYDAGKKIKGRKRHLLVDTLGLILALQVTAADVQDRDGAKGPLEILRHRFCRLRRVWADGGYAGALIRWVWRLRGQRRVCLEIVKRKDGERGFAVLPKRWIVERTLGWLMKSRRLRCDYERHTENSEAMMYLTMIRLMLHRLT